MATRLSALAHRRATHRVEPHEARDAGSQVDETAFGVSPESTVAVGAVRALVEMVARAGIGSAELLGPMKLRPEQLHDGEARIPRSELYLLCERALQLTADPALGLHWAERVTDSTFIPISQLIAHASTLREGIESMKQFSRLLSDDADYQIREAGECVTLQALPLIGASAPVQRFLGEMLVAGLFRLLCDFSMDAAPVRVTFAFRPPRYESEYTRVFGQVVSFDQPSTGIAFDRALLDLPAPHRDAGLHEALREVALRRLLEISERRTYAHRVREFLVGKGGPYRTDMDGAARAVGLSVRSLRRRLSAEGRSYQTVANEALQIVAKHMLVSRQYTIQETGYAMGFSDTRSFHRAFRRWTGVTPGTYRRTQRARPASEEDGV